MRYKICLVCIISFFLMSCNCVFPPQGKNDILSLTLTIDQSEVHSFREVKFEARLTNISDSDVLAHKRLFYLPYPAPASMAEMMLLVTDRSGNLVANETLASNHALPSYDTLIVLHPGEIRIKAVYLNAVGFYDGMFKIGEIYAAVVVYQNDLSVTKIINGVETHAWVGSIQSNKVTFRILP